MTHVVTESCIRCKYTDCVDVCPVDCFREGPNFLVIDPDECIDCAVCIPECPVNAIYAEEDTPADQVARLNRELREILAAPDVQAAFQTQGMDPATSSPEEFRRLVAQDAERWARLVKAQGIKPE